MGKLKIWHLSDALEKSKNAALVVGAGISKDAGIPLGYKVLMCYGESHQSILKKYDLLATWQDADKMAHGAEKWRLQERFVQLLVGKFTASIELQQSVLDWLYDFESMSGADSDIHAAIVVTWLNRVFNHLITTNWDFLLEYHLDEIYKEAYLAPFDPVPYTFQNGKTCSIKSARLFFLEDLENNDYFWHPRWDIVANVSDLPNLRRWARPIWKIHGSPFFLACPQCGGFSRWKHTERLNVNDACPEHPNEKLLPEIVFWGQGIDTAHPQVWKRVKDRLNRSDLIVVCGFSGSGSDVYIRSVIEGHTNLWVVNPDTGDWDIDRVNYVAATASDLAAMLLADFI